MLIKYVPSHLSSKEGRDNVNSVGSSLVHMINFVMINFVDPPILVPLQNPR